MVMVIPGSSLIPIDYVSSVSVVIQRRSGEKGEQLTSVVVLVDGPLDAALGAGGNVLGLEGGALGAHAARRVHGLLQGVALPAKDVVGVLPEPRVVARAEVEGLRAVRRPVVGVVERRRVPDHLVHELRDAHRVRRRAVPAQAEEGRRTARRVRHVRLVVGAVQVLAVPASVVWAW